MIVVQQSLSRCWFSSGADVRRNLPPKDDFLGLSIPEMQGYSIDEHVGSGGNAHVFRVHNRELNHDLACKIIPLKNLNESWRNEIQKANTLQSALVVRFVGMSKWIEAERGIDCVVLLWEFVSGTSLSVHIRRNRKRLAMSFVEHFLENMFDLFREMNDRGISHGDLHSGNVLVENRSESLVEPPYRIRVTDFGVASATSDALFRDDFDQLASILRELLENVDYQAASPRDRFSFNTLNDHFLARHLVERDPTRDPLARNPRALFERLGRIDPDFQQESEARAGHAKLTTPFDYLSCEQIGEAHSILRALYSNRFLGLSEVEARNNLLLTGPRGCGKSTVFKSLSLRHRLHSEKPSSVSYIGVYYRCDDLYFAFPRYRLPDREEGFDVPLHFMTVTLLLELLGTISIWAEGCHSEEFERSESRAVDALWQAFEWRKPESPDANTFSAFSARLRKERERAVKKQRFVHDPNHPFGVYLGAGALQEACLALWKNLAFLQQKPFYFFVDDYSAPKVTFPLQENLNRVLMQRSSCCFFKLSTESSVSYSPRDIDGKTYAEGREFSLLNLGLTFIRAAREEKLLFISDVFDRRLGAISGYPAESLDELIGEGADDPSNNARARAIRDGRKVEFNGKNCFCDLCSGDIHYLISLASQMVTASGGVEALRRSGGGPCVKPSVQSKAIRAHAGDFLKRLRGIHELGEQLVAIVTAFGNVANSFIKYKDSRNETGSPPHQATRIEPYEPFSLPEDAQKIYSELLRYSVFIEDVRGKSRRGSVVPRLYLRRFLIPHFKLTFSTRDSLEVEPREIEELLLRPADFEKRHRLKRPARNHGGQLDLLDGE